MTTTLHALNAPAAPPARTPRSARRGKLKERAITASAVIVGIAAIVALTGNGDDVTRARLQASVTADFSNEYVRQAAILGHPGVTVASTAAKTVCDKGGPTVPDVGPGANWSCMITFTDQTRTIQTGKFEVNAHANSCYTVGGPSKLIGLATITDTHGNTVVNPVSEFDGCFNPSS